MRASKITVPIVVAAAAVLIAAAAAVLAPRETQPPDIRHVATARSNTGYTYGGCRVYAPRDWFTTDLSTSNSAYVSAAVDPNSARILANFARAFPANVFNVNGTDATVGQGFVANLATNETPMVPVRGTTLRDDPYHDASTNAIPWTSAFLEQGSCATGDCHTIVLNTDTCVDYETYRYGAHSWDGSSFTASSGSVHNLNHPFNDQYAQSEGAVTKAGIPALGTVDLGEDAGLPSIDHAAALALPGSDASSDAAGGYVAPASSGPECVSFCLNKLPFGARLRLNAAKYRCPDPESYPQAHKICVQLETYGAIVVDHNGSSFAYGIGLNRTLSGSNPWNQRDVSKLNGIPITDWDVMKLGSVR